MKLERVLVVYKKSAFQLYARERKDQQFLRLLEKRHLVTHRFLHSHEAHRKALSLVHQIFRDRGIKTKFVYRAHAFTDRAFDLVLSVGGDGTFLEASHSVRTRPILGLNSNPIDSVGIFCGTTIEKLDDTLTAIENDRFPSMTMTRLQVKLGRKLIPIPVLNDVLITHPNPAATSRHILRWRGSEEEHKSSGIWICPAAGSTGAVRGAGGKFMPITSKNFQFCIREPYESPHRQFKIKAGTARPRKTHGDLQNAIGSNVSGRPSHVIYFFHGRGR